MSGPQVLARVRVSREVWRKLRSIAILSGKTVEELAGQAIQRFIEEVGGHEEKDN